MPNPHKSPAHLRASASRIGLIAAAALVVLTSLAGRARADAGEVTVTGSPPIVLLGNVDAGSVGLTDQSSVSALIQTSVATSLSCTLDNSPVSCGAPPSTCSAAVCEQFTASGLSPGDHELSAKTSDGSYGLYDFDVDMTPPDTTVIALNEGIDVNPLRPQFTFGVTNGDDQDLGATSGPPYTLDSAQCSMTPIGNSPNWSACPMYFPGGDFEGFKDRASLPAQHVNYLFQARGIDPLGRVDPTPASMLYDPIPCGVSVRAPKTKPALLHSGVTVTLQCTGQVAVRLYLLLVKKNGRQLRNAASLGSPLFFTTSPGIQTYRRRLKVGAPLYLTGARTYTLTARAITPMISGSSSFTVSAGPSRRSGPGPQPGADGRCVSCRRLERRRRR